MAKPKRPRDPNQLAKLIVDIATGEAQDKDPNAGKNPAAVRRGRAGGLKGGKARAGALTKAARAKIARNAAKAPWNKP